MGRADLINREGQKHSGKWRTTLKAVQHLQLQMMLQSKDIICVLLSSFLHSTTDTTCSMFNMRVTSTALLDTIRLCKSPSVMLESRLPWVALLMGFTPVLLPALVRTGNGRQKIYSLIIHMPVLLPFTRTTWLPAKTADLRRSHDELVTRPTNSAGDLLGEEWRSKAFLTEKSFSTYSSSTLNIQHKNGKRGTKC